MEGVTQTSSTAENCWKRAAFVAWTLYGGVRELEC